MAPFEYHAYVAKMKWKEAPPMITKFTPGYDVSIDSAVAKGSVDISFHFSHNMDCDGVTESITISSLNEDDAGNAEIDNSSVKCTTLTVHRRHWHQMELVSHTSECPRRRPFNHRQRRRSPRWQGRDQLDRQVYVKSRCC